MLIFEKVFLWLCTLDRPQFLRFVRIAFLALTLSIYSAVVFYFDGFDSYEIHIFVVGVFVFQASYLGEGLWDFHLKRRTEYRKMMDDK